VRLVTQLNVKNTRLLKIGKYKNCSRQLMNRSKLKIPTQTMVQYNEAQSCAVENDSGGKKLMIVVL
jgi:hypothetical protein